RSIGRPALSTTSTHGSTGDPYLRASASTTSHSPLRAVNRHSPPAPGFSMTPLAVPGTGIVSCPASTSGNSPTTTVGPPRTGPCGDVTGTGNFVPGAASAGAFTVTVCDPRCTPSTRTVRSVPRGNPSGATPVTTGTVPTCRR